MKYLAIDYGTKRIGLAVGAMIPKGAGVLSAEQSEDEIIEAIKQICREEEIGGIVIGLPIRSRGELGTLGEKIMQFGALVHGVTGLPVYYQPEEFTSAEANTYLKHPVTTSREKGRIDELAAILILERFLEERSEGKVV